MAKTILFLFGLLAVSSKIDASLEKHALKSVTKGNLLLSKEMYQIASKNAKGNVLISPLSVELVLAMAHAGARGETARQITTALHLPENKRVLQSGFHAFMNTLKSSKNTTIEIANKIFSGNQNRILEAYKHIAKKSFLSEAENLDFGNPTTAAAKINSWVEKKTHNKITNLVTEDTLDAMTRMVLVNAIYFKGLWKNSFDKYSTKQGKFFVRHNEIVYAPMMHQKGTFAYGLFPELDATAIEMPYQGDNLSMFILLPNDYDGIAKLESKVKDLKLSEILYRMNEIEIEVTLPRFKIEEKTEFKDILEKMGIRDMFNAGSADFSGISGTGGLYVSQVIQKAFIEVNEEGTEAAAATAVHIEPLSLGMIPNRFEANHPFLFMMLNKSLDTVLFCGRLLRP